MKPSPMTNQVIDGYKRCQCGKVYDIPLAVLASNYWPVAMDGERHDVIRPCQIRCIPHLGSNGYWVETIECLDGPVSYANYENTGWILPEPDRLTFGHHNPSAAKNTKLSLMIRSVRTSTPSTTSGEVGGFTTVSNPLTDGYVHH